MADDDGYLDDDTRQWIQHQADRHYDGNWGRAAAAILEAAHAAARTPDDPWADLDAQLRHRTHPTAPLETGPETLTAATVNTPGRRRHWTTPYLVDVDEHPRDRHARRPAHPKATE